MNANAMAGFAAALAGQGLVPPEIIADGEIRRFDAPDDKPGRKSAWYVLYDGDVAAGAFGCWKSDLSGTWCEKSSQTMSPEERKAYRERIAKAKVEAAAARAQAQTEAAGAARRLWKDASAAQPDNPYCIGKDVQPWGLKEFTDPRTLIVPIHDGSGSLVNLQFIGADGVKRFKSGGKVSGCFYRLGDLPAPGETLLIGEGFATCASAFEATRHPAVVAFNAHNLLPVARLWRQRLPQARIVLLADDDHRVAGNPGLTHAAQAAREVGGLLAVPDFGAGRPNDATDFNDLHRHAGPDAVRACIRNAAHPVTSCDGADGATAHTDGGPCGGKSPETLVTLAQEAIARTLAGDAGALFEVTGTLGDLRADHPADYARIRARIRRECHDVKLGELERRMRSDVDPADEKSVADLLIELADDRCELFHDPDRHAYARLDGGGHRECWPVRSDGFREWLSYSFYQRHGRAPTELSITTALATIEGKAKFDGEERLTHLRVASVGDAIWIDLCNDAWEAIEVTTTGWRLVDTPPLDFIRTSGMRALPMPVPGGSIAHLWDIANVPEGDRLFVVTWLLECFRIATPFAVLELTGEQGSAKSTTQHYLRELVDPNRSNNRAAPRNVDDVFVSAGNAHLMSFENLSHLGAAYQDALCVLATGGGYATRRLFTNTEEMVLDLKRPIVLNGIAVIVTAQDLSDRTLHVDLPEIRHRATADQIQAAFEAHRNSIFGGLLDVLAQALAELQTVRAEHVALPRMADFAQLGEAVYRVHGRPPGAFLLDYAERRRESVHRTLEASPVAMAMLAYMDENPAGFEGTIGRLHDVLTGYRQDAEAWPKSAKGMGDAFRRLAPALRQIGIRAWASERRGKQGYVCSLRRTNGTDSARADVPAAGNVHHVHDVHPNSVTKAGNDVHGELHPMQEHRGAHRPAGNGKDYGT